MVEENGAMDGAKVGEMDSFCDSLVQIQRTQRWTCATLRLLDPTLHDYRTSIHTSLPSAVTRWLIVRAN